MVQVSSTPHLLCAIPTKGVVLRKLKSLSVFVLTNKTKQKPGSRDSNERFGVEEIKKFECVFDSAVDRNCWGEKKSQKVSTLAKLKWPNFQNVCVCACVC